MSAYLMSQYDTTKLAVFAKSIDLVPCAIKAARILRRANNYALMARYGDKPVALRGVPKTLNEGIIFNACRADILRLANTFIYQCSEGSECEKQKGYILLTKIIKALE